MTPLIRKLTNLFLYSSLWISACAASLVLFTYDVTGGHPGPVAYVGFVFCGTLALYALHRLTGIERVKRYADQGRFIVIAQYKWHILIYGCLGALGAVICFFELPRTLWLWLIIPCILSVLYALPMRGGRRLRDVSWIKIFLVSTIWAVLTGVIPYSLGVDGSVLPGILIFVERTCWVFAITLPFDVRDMRADALSGVRTLPHWLGENRSRYVALAVLVLSALMTTLLLLFGVYAYDLIVPYAIVFIVALILIARFKPNMDDYYFTGLLDGTMLMLPLMYWLWNLP